MEALTTLRDKLAQMESETSDWHGIPQDKLDAFVRGDWKADSTRLSNAHDVSGEARDDKGEWTAGGAGKPKPGERAASAHAKYHEYIAAAKKARIDAFNEVKADAEKAMEAHQSLLGAMVEANNNIFHFDESTEMDELISEGQYERPSDEFQRMKDIENAAREAMVANRKQTIGNGEENPTAAQIEENAMQFSAIIKNAKAAREALKAYVQHRKEMKAIKSGDVQLSAAYPDDGTDWDALLAKLEQDVSLSAVADKSGHYHKDKGPGGGQFTKHESPDSHVANAIDTAVSEATSDVTKVIENPVKEAVELGKDIHDAVHHVGKEAFHALPKPIQTAIEKSVQVAFAGWGASQELYERALKERGYSSDQAKQFRDKLAWWDVLLFKPVAVAAHFGGPVAAVASWIIPPATGLFILGSTAKNPMATYRAAKSLIGDAHEHYTQSLSQAAPDQTKAHHELIDAMEAHDWSEWYRALLLNAAQKTKELRSAIKLADAAFAKHPKDRSVPRDDDADVVFGGDDLSLSQQGMLWDESAEPRDEIGRWTKGASAPPKEETAPVIDPEPEGEPAAPKQEAESAAPHLLTQDEFVKQRIEDFGEKIGGARKDMAAGQPRAPRARKQADEDDETAGWERRYEIGQIISSSKDDDAAANAAADAWLKDVSTRVAKLKQDNMGLLLKKGITDRFARAVTNGEMTAETYDAKVADGTILNDEDYEKAVAIEQEIQKARDTEMLVPKSTTEKNKWVVRDKKMLDWHGQARQRGGLYDTEEQARAAIPLIEVARNHSVTNIGPKDAPSYAIYRKVSDRKHPIVKDGFASYEDAMKYMATHPREIIETKVRIDDSIHPELENIERIGKDYRHGKQAVPDDFKEFGFRGVEFGNWNNNAERLHILNHAYDSFRALADILGVPPKELSLDGQLGLGFGSRGHGLSGARAHYERNYATINLTKLKGAGALAHEWMHALDHYLGRKSGKASSEKATNARGDMVYKTSGSAGGDYVSHGHHWKLLPTYRAELKQAVDDVMHAIMNRKIKYTEDESLHEQRMKRNAEYLETALKSFRDEMAADHSNDKYTRGHKKFQLPASPEQMREIDELLNKIRSGDAGEDMPLPTKAQFGGHMVPKAMVRLNELYKEVRGRNAWYKHQNGSLGGTLADIIAWHGQKKAGDKFLNEAKEQKEKEKTVKTDYYSQARRMDQGTAGDYWSEPHEMMARAFESYVYDKLKERDKGDRDDFLAYEKHNDLPEYRLFGVKPYPEGEERATMGRAFDRLFEVIRAEKGGAA